MLGFDDHIDDRGVLWGLRLFVGGLCGLALLVGVAVALALSR